MARFESKDIILTKKLNNVIYECMVKTNSDMVYTEDDKTLTETISDISDLLTEYHGEYSKLEVAFNAIVKDAPSTFNSFKEVWDYVNINGNPKSELIRLIESKQAAEEGKGLSTHDFDDILYAKLKFGYSKEELDDKFKVILDTMETTNTKIEELKTKPNIIISETTPEELPNYTCWYQIISRDDK